MPRRFLLAMAALSAPLPAIAQTRCDGVVDGLKLSIRPHAYRLDNMPTGDRVPYPAADALVTCRIKSSGYLDECVSSLAGQRGDWLARLTHLWKVLDREIDGCPLAGRQLVLRFRFLEYDQGISFRRSPRWEPPLNP